MNDRHANVVTLIAAVLLAGLVGAHARGQEPKKVPPKVEAPPPKLIAFTPPTKEYAREFRQSFAGKTAVSPGWEVINSGPEQHVRFEAAGVRITLPPGREEGHRAAGLRSVFEIQGDFEITLDFEILKEVLAGGNRTVLDLAITTDVPEGDVTTVGRKLGPKTGSHFVGWSSMWNPAAQKKVPHMITVPTNVMKGRLGAVRSGADLYYGFSDGFDGEFRYFKKAPFGAEDVRRIRIVGAADGENATLDVRVTDFRLRADSIPNMPAAPLPGQPIAQAIDQPLPPGKGGLVAVLIGGVAVSLLLAAGLGAVVLVRRRKAAPSDAAQPSTAAAGLVVCPECGKKLNVRPELAGKKVKCTQCGNTLVIAENG